MTMTLERPQTSIQSEMADDPRWARIVARDKTAVAIPCHRVVRNDGSLSGYAWGVERKRVLLDREAALGER